MISVSFDAIEKSLHGFLAVLDCTNPVFEIYFLCAEAMHPVL